ncbi:hypothetical protein PIB30_099549, partial [Stylosanthes scabra]|nr:hypothetical protein [Stylosanthes scabra]
MGSGVIYYEYEKREKFEDYDLKADAELGTIKIRRYHFDDESFVHPLHSVRFDPDRLYEVSIEALMADQPLSSSGKGRTSVQGSHRSRRLSPMPHYSLRMSSSTLEQFCILLLSWVVPFVIEWLVGWCEGDEEEKEIGGMEPSVEKEEANIDAIEDYLQFIKELERHPVNSSIHSGQVSVLDLPEDSSNRRSISHGASSYDFSG